MSVPISVIQKVVSEYYDVPIPAINSARRSSYVVRPRHMAMYLATMLTSLTTSDIGKEFGGRDHATVAHARKRVDEENIVGSETRKVVDLLVNKINRVEFLGEEMVASLPRIGVEDAINSALQTFKAELEKNFIDEKKHLEIHAAAKVAELAFEQPKPITKIIVKNRMMDPDSPFCKAAAEVSLAAVEAEEAKFTNNEGIANQKMEKAAIAFAKEFHKIRSTLERKTS